MKVLHFGDLHCWHARPVWNDILYPKRPLGLLNLWLNRRKRFPPEVGRKVLQGILQEDADLVVFSGDMTTQSSPEEFRESARLFKPLFEKWGDRMVVIPGNHDRYTPGSVKKRLYEAAFPTGVLDPETRILQREIDDDICVIGFDASEPFRFRSNGRFTSGLADALGRELNLAAATGRKVILVGHFPYATPHAHPEKWNHDLIGKEKLIAVLRRHPPAVYLHGHKHVRWLLHPTGTPGVPCIDCGSAGMISENPDKQAGYVCFSLDADGVVSGVQARVMQPNGRLDTTPLSPSEG